MNSFRKLLLLSAFLITTQYGRGATLTVDGVPNFDTSLGSLIRVSVTVDPLPRTTYSTGSLLPWEQEPIALHHHLFTFPSIFVRDRWAVFPATPTDEVKAPGEVHFHVYDAPPVNLIFEDGGQVNFINFGPVIPSGVFMAGITTSVAEGHYHDTPNISFNFNTETRTTFEYAPFNVPEPNPVMSWIVLAVAFVKIRRPNR
jgi:hypothetical protein